MIEVERGHIVCLNQFPFKPMEIIGKTATSIGMRPYPLTKNNSVQWFNIAEFNEKDYILYESLNLW